MAGKYALVRHGEIIKYRNVPGDDVLLAEKLSAHKYLPVEEESPPDADWATQSLADTYVIEEDRVIRMWVITEREFEIAKMMKHDALKLTTLDHIGVELESDAQETEVLSTLAARNLLFAQIEEARTNEDLRAIIIEV